MHMPVDESRRDQKAAQVVRLPRLRERAARMNAGDHFANDADVGLAQFERRDVDDLSASLVFISGSFIKTAISLYSRATIAGSVLAGANMPYQTVTLTFFSSVCSPSDGRSGASTDRSGSVMPKTLMLPVR